MRKIPFAGIELTSQRVRGLRGTSELRGLRGTSELPGRPAMTSANQTPGRYKFAPLVAIMS